MGKELVSIIIPVFNRVDFLVDAVNCAVNQTYENLEVIIIDNKSTDGTWNKAIELQNIFKDKVKIYQNSENIGPVLNWKRGIEYACGEYIKLLFSDDIIELNFIEETMHIFTEDCAFVMSGIKIIDSSTKNIISTSKFQYISSINSDEYIKDILYSHSFGFPVSPGCAIFRKNDAQNNLLTNIPNTDNLLHINNGAGIDLLLFLLTALNYPKVKTTERTLSVFYAHEDSITIASKGNIAIYYDWAIYHFASTHYLKALPYLKSIFFLKNIKYAHYANLYKQLSGANLHILFLIKKILKYII